VLWTLLEKDAKEQARSEEGGAYMPLLSDFMTF